MREILHIISLSTMLAMTFIVFITFIVAYAAPTKSAFVLVNSLGEADVELVLLSSLLLLNTFVTLTMSKSMYSDYKEQNVLRKLRFLRRNKKYVRELEKPYFITSVRN